MYKFYATLLDSFQRYLDSQSEDSLKEFIDKVNRVPFVSEAAQKGTAFNTAVDLMKNDELPEDCIAGDLVIYNEFAFDKSLVGDFAVKFKNAVAQVYTSAVLPTPKGEVLLYGYADEILAFKGYDIKTTGRYDFPKYHRGYQHLVYPYCFRKSGTHLESFEYTITDFSEIYTEEYVFNEQRDTQRLVNICEHLIGFLELKKELITDRKVFGLEAAIENSHV